MPLPEFLELTYQVLKGQTSATLAEELLRETVETTGSRAGALRQASGETFRWPRTLSEQVEEATEGWSEFTFGSGDDHWRLRLLQVDHFDETTLTLMRMALKAWQVNSELKRARFDERFHLWELEAIRSIATSIGGLDDPTELAEELIAHVVALLGVRSAQLYLDDDDAPVGRFGEPVLNPDEVRAARREGIYRDDVIALPLVAETDVLGVVVVAHKEARAGTEPFASQDMRLLELFALQVTVALEYARLSRESLERDRLQRELEVAAAIQGHLLPQSAPRLEGVRIEARSTPSRHVGGDTYDLLVHESDLVVAVTDVSGKGVGAGLIASGVQAGVRLLVPEDYRLEDLAARLNSFLCGATEDNRFATFAMVRITPEGELFAVNAGHCPILIARQKGGVERVDSSGLPLGILPIGGYQTAHLTLEIGDLVVLYTDGFTEAEDSDEQEFGVERVCDVIDGAAGGAAGATAALFSAVEEFTQGRPLHDDATLVVVEWVGR